MEFFARTHGINLHVIGRMSNPFYTQPASDHPDHGGITIETATYCPDDPSISPFVPLTDEQMRILGLA